VEITHSHVRSLSHEHDSTEQLLFVVNAVPALIAYVDAQARYVWTNESYRRWFGYPSEQLRGRHVSEVLGAPAWDRIRPYVERVLSGEEVVFDDRLIYKSGPGRTVRAAYVPHRDGSGRIRGFVALVNDITEIRTAELALRRSEHMLEQSQSIAHVGCWELTLSDGGADSLHVSDETYRIFGHEPGAADISEAVFFGSVHPEDREVVRAAREAVRTLPNAGPEFGEGFENEFRIVRPDGTLRSIQAWTKLERDGAGTLMRVLGTCQDITERKRAEEEVRQAREQLQLVMDSTAAFIARYDRRRRIVWTNRSNAARFGKTPEQIVGRPLWEIEGDAAYLVLEESIDRVLNGKTVQLEVEVPYQTLGPRWMHLVYSPTFASGGEPDGWVSVLTDNTHRRELERALRLSEERYRSLALAITSVVWTASAEGKFVEAQPAWEAYTGQVWEQHEGWGWTGALHADDRERIETLLSEAESTGASYRSACRVWHASSAGYRFCERSAVAMRNPDGTIREWIGTLVDVHDRERALQELKEADRRKDEFLAMLSHELRNPLAPILHAVENLNQAGPDQRELAATSRTVITRQVQHMKRLLDDLLDVSRVSQGKIQLRKELVELGALLLQAMEVSRPLIIEKQQQLSMTLVQELLPMEADPTRLVQVFANLLNNAAKYTDRGGHVSLTVRVENGEAVVQVRDDGIGMSPDLLVRAFDLFVQDTRSLDRAQGGLGIGLTMVRTLVKMHGGSVRALSEGPGRGSEIVVRLPLAREAKVPVPRAHTSTAEAKGRPLRVLVVDDNVDAASTLADLLELFGHEVTLAHDGPSAIAAAARMPPELVLLDLGLPGMDGYAVAARLREAGHDHPVLVALTGYGQDEDRRRSRAAGFDHHLVKPVDFAVLEEIAADLQGRTTARKRPRE
jgi:two-component system CheB/CheR fusion protein